VNRSKRSWIGEEIPAPRKGKWAVLCPGEVVRLFDLVDQSEFAGVIGVNRAVCHYHCDWAAMMDFKTFGEILTVHPDSNVGGFLSAPGGGKPGLILPEADGRAILDEHRKHVGGMRVLSMNRLHDERKLLGVPWTINVATQAAWCLGADEVEVFGASWKGDKDVDGFRAKGDRSDLRWKKEHNVFQRTKKFLAERGCRVTRVTPESLVGRLAQAGR